MLIKAASDYPSNWLAIQAIKTKTGCTPEALRSWHKQHIEQTTPASVVVGCAQKLTHKYKKFS